MGCAHSNISDTNPRMFKARNLNDKDKSVNRVVLEVLNSKVIVHSKSRKVMASWPIGCIRRYGCNRDNILFIEAGNGCDTGQGMYLFKCARTEQVFELLKQYWDELQASHGHPSSVNHLVSSLPLPNQTAIPTTTSTQQYYNTNNLAGTDHTTSSTANYTNGSVRVPSTSSTSVPSVTPPPRGSTSSQHAPTGLASLPEGTPLLLDSPDAPFNLQPAPTSRKEMINRRRINSDMQVAMYSRNTDHVTLGSSQRRNSESANYENNDVMDIHTGSFPRRQGASYSKKTQQVKLMQSGSTTSTKGGKSSANPTSSDSITVSPDLTSPHRDVGTLGSDCEPLLTPGSKSSGIGSLNGNGASILPSNPPPIPPAITDPWKRHPKFSRHRISPSYGPHSAREYVNTANASMDVSGTPLPATAVGGMHFTFDFDALGFLQRSRSAGNDRSKLNYVPVEIIKNSDVEFNCGASSASSGIPGTPRTPKTPKTPMSAHPATDYAIIDQHKTRALSNIHRARQRERNTRHTSTEMAVMNAV